MMTNDIGNTLSHVIKEMMYSERDFNEIIPLEEHKNIAIKFKDQIKVIRTTIFTNWESQHINTLIALCGDEEFTFFENITYKEFVNMNYSVWRANEMHLMDILVFAGGRLLFEKSKDLYHNLKRRTFF